MTPLSMIETTPGAFTLMLATGGTRVDDLVEELGHTPNGYFWEGVAQLLVETEAPELEGAFEYDPEAGTFVALGRDRGALERLGALLAEVANDGLRLRRLMDRATELGFEFDD